MCTRPVSRTLRTGTLTPAPLPQGLQADCHREARTRLCIDPGDVEAFSLPRIVTRWPHFDAVTQSVGAWLRLLGIPAELFENAEVAFMGCRGASYHHDGARYGGIAFCNLFLSEDQDLAVRWPAIGKSLPPTRGTVALFDPCQPHGIVDAKNTSFDAADFTSPDRLQFFLTWELPIEHPAVAKALGISFDLAGQPSNQVQEPSAPLRLDNEPVTVCPRTGECLPMLVPQ